MKVGRLDDPAEHEADRIAGQVMRTSAPSATSEATVQAVEGKTIVREPTVRAPTSAAVGIPLVSPDVQSGIEHARRSGGVPVSSDVRGFFEPRLDHSLSNVRIHADAPAARLAERLDARAFTVGGDVFFGRGQFRPGTASGQRLLAHEMVHAIQQRAEPDAGIVRRASRAGEPVPVIPSAGSTREAREFLETLLALPTHEMLARVEEIDDPVFLSQVDQALRIRDSEPTEVEDLRMIQAALRRQRDRIAQGEVTPQQVERRRERERRERVGRQVREFESGRARRLDVPSARTPPSSIETGEARRGEGASLRERRVEGAIARLRAAARRAGGFTGTVGHGIGGVLVAKSLEHLPPDVIQEAFARLQAEDPAAFARAMHEGETIKALQDRGVTGLSGFVTEGQDLLEGLVIGLKEAELTRPSQPPVFSMLEMVVVWAGVQDGVPRGILEAFVDNIELLRDLFTREFWVELADAVSKLIDSEAFRRDVGVAIAELMYAEIETLNASKPFSYGQTIGRWTGMLVFEIALGVLTAGAGAALEASTAAELLKKLSAVTRLAARAGKAAAARHVGRAVRRLDRAGAALFGELGDLPPGGMAPALATAVPSGRVGVPPSTIPDLPDLTVAEMRGKPGGRSPRTPADVVEKSAAKGGMATREAAKSAARISDEVKCFGFCIEFATRLRRALRRKRIPGARIRLEAQGRRIGDIRGKGTLVGDDVHEAILVEGTVFDNLNPQGLPFEEWRDSLRLLGAEGERIPDELFTFTPF